MIGIVMIGHAHIASQMNEALQHILGEQPLIATVDINDESSTESLAAQLERKIRSCDVGDGVLLLADMFGGTPCNIAMGFLQAGRVEVVSGFNLPLLIKAATIRDKAASVSELANHVVDSGRQYIRMASDLQRSKRA
ncbi:PTS sugar transporter subunit IIA [Mariprofundus ferrooxydans]|jgi:PTS system mannose-specific IIA component|uniref:PTS system fructose subfamily IIA component n=1 Tax=Mariprofundus ferrooxydans PV-1 TaxID=314345 RepID=Q0EWV5_9PROT|nr:PTS sugar transporter subunit IIA [Mariprofundus ferrooxydans]EAU53802.1 PTS system fructose subfamily IIA component [Mariprofundus ferrooxydans PV-1]KON47549.1 PTS system fructose subfamily IIA component [Mariprofundus ferrooxydans]